MTRSATPRASADRIFEAVRRRIVSGALPADQPIRQDALALAMGVSKIPVREALARLEREGLVVAHANRGFFVASLTREEAEEVFALRLKIEPGAEAAGALAAGPADHRAAHAALARLEAAIAAGAHARAGRLNRDFHLALARPCRRPVTLQIAERLHVLAERYASKHLEPGGRERRANAEHRALLAAWEAGEAASVKVLSRDHIAGALRDLRTEFAGTSGARSRRAGAAVGRSL